MSHVMFLTHSYAMKEQKKKQNKKQLKFEKSPQLI